MTSPRFCSAFLSSIVLLLYTVFMIGSSAQEPLDVFPNKKFIELGWDIPDTAYLRQHHEAMQQTTPFDGVMLAIEVNAPDGKRCSTQSMMDATPWEPAWFASAVDDLKACRWTTFTDNFLRFNFTPGNLEWNDDTGWSHFCNKTALCAQIAQETGLKGFAVDFEPYGKAIFTYSASEQSFEEMQSIVRKRGQQWMKAIAEKYPDMILFTLFVADVNLSAGYDDHPDTALKTLHYGLLPAFFNGMLDAVPPKMRIVDGCETGYSKYGINEFVRLAWAVRSIGGPAIRLAAPENREKYINQVQVGFGFYLDMYTNPEGDTFYRGPKEGGTRLDRFEENLVAAWEATDQYVWLYGEQRRWWKPADPAAKWQHWEDALPGMNRVIRFTKNPREAAKQEINMLRKDKRAVNLLKNPGFTESRMEKSQAEGPIVERAIPIDWHFWQDKPLGTYLWEKGRARVNGVKWGCILQNVRPVQPGEHYYAAIDAKQEGAGQISMRIRWQDSEGKYVKESEDKIFSFEKDPPQIDGRTIPNGWLRAEGIVKIPEGVAAVQVQAGVRDQSTESDAAWFTDAVLLRLR